MVIPVKLFEVSINVAALPEEINTSWGTGVQLAKALLLYNMVPELPTAMALDTSNAYTLLSVTLEYDVSVHDAPEFCE